MSNTSQMKSITSRGVFLTGLLMLLTTTSSKKKQKQPIRWQERVHLFDSDFHGELALNVQGDFGRVETVEAKILSYDARVT